MRTSAPAFAPEAEGGGVAQAPAGSPAHTSTCLGESPARGTAAAASPQSAMSSQKQSAASTKGRKAI